MATEKRLIYANALLTEVVKLQALSPEHAVAKIILMLTEMKGVDAVAVVRCRECKHWNNRGCGNQFGFCKAWEIMRKADGYCDCGEKKDNG